MEVYQKHLFWWLEAIASFFSNLRPTAISHAMHPSVSFPVSPFGGQPHPGIVDLVRYFLNLFRVFVF